jgi:translation initiation factor IF-3
MLVIDQDGNKLGVISRAAAFKKAEAADLDLVLIAPGGKPPVAKIVDYGKYRYEKKKRESEAKKNQKVVEQKEVRITPNIGQHDLDVKIRNAQKFLSKGNKVKLSLQFRGRENANREVGFATMDRALDTLKDVADIDKSPKLNGRFYDAYLAPKK